MRSRRPRGVIDGVEVVHVVAAHDEEERLQQHRRGCPKAHGEMEPRGDPVGGR